MAERDWIIGFLKIESCRVIAGLRIDTLPDPNDACFIEVAAEAGLPFVTGNLKHYPKRSRAVALVLSPRELIEHWKKSEGKAAHQDAAGNTAEILISCPQPIQEKLMEVSIPLK